MSNQPTIERIQQEVHTANKSKIYEQTQHENFLLDEKNKRANKAYDKMIKQSVNKKLTLADFVEEMEKEVPEFINDK